jgi:hypothetical protein
VKVFISWSGKLSKEVASKLYDWLPNVIQGLEPYLSCEDIEKGAKWFPEISNELGESNFGIICLTRKNMNEPWILFEAGALSKQVEKSRVTPLLVDVSSTDVTGPLAQFQHTEASKQDMKKLLSAINTNSGETKLKESALNAAFDIWWSEFESEFEKIKEAQPASKDITAHRPDRELLEEAVTISRSIQSMMAAERKEKSVRDVARAFLEKQYSKNLGFGDENVFTGLGNWPSIVTQSFGMDSQKLAIEKLTTPQQAILMDLCYEPAQSIEDLVKNTKLPKQLVEQALDSLPYDMIRMDSNHLYSSTGLDQELRRELATKGGQRRSSKERDTE